MCVQEQGLYVYALWQAEAAYHVSARLCLARPSSQRLIRSERAAIAAAASGRSRVSPSMQAKQAACLRLYLRVLLQLWTALARITKCAYDVCPCAPL